MASILFATIRLLAFSTRAMRSSFVIGRTRAVIDGRAAIGGGSGPRTASWGCRPCAEAPIVNLVAAAAATPADENRRNERLDNIASSSLQRSLLPFHQCGSPAEMVGASYAPSAVETTNLSCQATFRAPLGS